MKNVARNERKRVDRKFGEVMYTNATGASEILNNSEEAVYRLVRKEKAREKKARESHKALGPSSGIPFYQADEGTELWFPIPGLYEFIRSRTRGMAFRTEDK